MSHHRWWKRSPSPPKTHPPREDDHTDYHLLFGDGTDAKAEDEMRRHKDAFYRIYSEISKRRKEMGFATARDGSATGPPSTPGERREFRDLVDGLTYKSKISYGIVGWLFHTYLCHCYFRRVILCANSPSTWGLITHPMETLTSCKVHPFTFLDWISILELLFYTLCLAGQVMYRPLERWILTYGVYVTNGAVCTAWWFLSRAAVRDAGWRWCPPQMGGCGTWTTLWSPVLHWWLFLLLRRRALALAHWEVETLLVDAQAMARIKIPIGNGFRLQTPPFYRRPYTCYQLWACFSSALPILIWEWYIKHPAPKTSWQPTDLAVWPGLVKVVIVTAGSTVVLKGYFSFLSFQNRCVAWTEPFRKGLVFGEADGVVTVGIIY
ncbi:uncharacterized protein EV422DRAFT_391307 [Fimicolochytrium jonesii]|uniref:uncharacterized protein n=1 Tax=Fimicolochytrium jonesii TaxID=1396493 RepID=UPI0022FE065D|nr:uncharacterized protein EV422DRAFT_391307 [Fimicolochytrium jonesii]KAI8823083.1 hypothetical protein EV422DRAFT_391307 [Fimicolochytrium jonesii]